jgi:hypothetical protein
VTILLAADDDNLIRTLSEAPASRCVAACTTLECVENVRRQVPDLLILDEYLPSDGPDGVLDVLADDEQRVNELPNRLLTRGGRTPTNPHWRNYGFARESCGRKPAENVEMFGGEEAGLA